MIDKALGFIVDRLNAALQQPFPSSEPHVVMADLNGTDAAKVENKVILSVANIERETGTQAPVNFRPDPSGYNKSFPPLNINVLILVAASFANYAEALKFLSSTLAFFQSSMIMTPATAPNFPAGIDRLALDFVNVSVQELNSLWSIRGSQYLPSFLLRIRTVTLAKDDILTRVPPITGVDTSPVRKT